MTLLRLDGATDTELQRRGVVVRPPWWTSSALRTERGVAVLGTVHSDYVAAGADVVTANTFRCNLRSMRRAGLTDEEAAILVDRAVGVARSSNPRIIAGSMAPVEDCYRPDLVPDVPTLRAEHRWLARSLGRTGVDAVLVETMNTIVEARTALAAVLEAGGHAWVSFVVGAGARLLSGEPIADAVSAVERDGAEAVLVNCASLPHTEAALRVMASVANGPIGAYPNVEDRRGIPPATHVDRHVRPLVDPVEFADVARRWIEQYGLGLVGGCCGTTPDHLKKIW